MFQVLSWLVILFTGFFIPVIILLVFIQSKNFTSNRTTSERFSRRKPPVKKDLNKERKPLSTSESLDSTGSSLASHMIDPRLAEDIIREYSEVPDFS